MRACAALALANARYWRTVAPVVRGELARWEERAQTIANPQLRELALEKLREESFHARAAAMLATLAPAPRREDATRAIVALELLFDYLDGLTERPLADPLGDGERLFAAYTSVANDLDGRADLDGRDLDSRADLDGCDLDNLDFDLDLDLDGRDRQRKEGGRGRTDRGEKEGEDGGYAWALAGATRAALRRLPAATAVAPSIQASLELGAQAQIRMHAAAEVGIEQAEEWARAQGAGELGWRELLAGGASSVLAVHALIAAASDPATTPERAQAIARAYMWTCVMLTLLDGLVDHHRDAGVSAVTGAAAIHPTYAGLYRDRARDEDGELLDTLTHAGERALQRARELPDGVRHATIALGVVAYYAAAPGAEREPARSAIARLREQMGPALRPALTLLRVWRGRQPAKRRPSETRRLGSAGAAPRIEQAERSVQTGAEGSTP